MIPFPPQTEEAGFLEDERRRLLTHLIPPLVHRMNNALAVMHGLSEVGEGQEQAGAMAREFEIARSLMARLSGFARSQAATVEAFDLREVVKGVCLFLRPFAEAAGIALEFREPLQAAILHNDPLRVEQLITVVVAEELTSLADEGDALSPRYLRLALRQAPGRTVLTLVRPHARGDAPPPLVAEAAKWADANAASLYMRTMGAVTCYRFVFPSLEEAAEAGFEPGFIDEPKNLLLVEGDGPLCELIKTVCNEAGYEVEEAEEKSFDPRTIEPSAIDLVLFDTDLELRRPGLLARLEKHLAASAPEGSSGLLLLGEPPEGSASGATPYLPKPF